MPKLWNDSIESHRSAVIGAIMDKTAELAATEGPTNLTMARIAQETGIGRATLYKYFGDIESILVAWHQRQIGAHMARLHQLRHEQQSPLQAIEAVLLTYGEMTHKQHSHALRGLLHAMPHVRHSHEHLRAFVARLIDEAAAAGEIETDLPAAELAAFALAAVEADFASSTSGLKRLVGMIVRGLGARPVR